MKIKNLCLQQRPTVKQPIGDSDRMIQQWIFQLGQGTPNERLAGVSGLSALMSSSRPEQRSEPEVALSNAIAIEASQTVRHAIVSSFANLDPKIVGPAELDKVISLLAQESRGLVLEGDLWVQSVLRTTWTSVSAMSLQHVPAAEREQRDVRLTRRGRRARLSGKGETQTEVLV